MYPQVDVFKMHQLIEEENDNLNKLVKEGSYMSTEHPDTSSVQQFEDDVKRHNGDRLFKTKEYAKKMGWS